MLAALPNPFYYLENFQSALDWIRVRHAHALSTQEASFLEDFPQLPQASRALLVRMAMRKGAHFRVSKLRYAEIGCTLAAAAPLVARGWVDDRPLLSSKEIGALLTREEIARHLSRFVTNARMGKAAMLRALDEADCEPMCLDAWCEDLPDVVLHLGASALCERLCVMYFGNARQDWSEFVLADLAIFRYEPVDLDAACSVWRSQQDVDDYLHLHRCSERLAGEPALQVLADIPALPYDSEWIERRRGKLLFRLAMLLEREGDLPQALRLHAANPYPGARARAIRVLERLDQPHAALELARHASAQPESEAEAQQLARMLPRLGRAAGCSSPRPPPAAAVQRIDLMLASRGVLTRVEAAVRDHLTEPHAPVHYVENTLFGALFALLCWDALYAPLPGAFFHPFHAAAADLHHPDFPLRRAELFASCLACLESDDHRARIRQNFHAKRGVHTPFIAWGLLTEELLEQALACVPGRHLKAIFDRMLGDLRNNLSGLPDLIQFWPQARQYRMIEVKGPGDRLQDNQRRWLHHFAAWGIPAAVCHVEWASQTP